MFHMGVNQARDLLIRRVFAGAPKTSLAQHFV